MEPAPLIAAFALRGRDQSGNRVSDRCPSIMVAQRLSVSSPRGSWFPQLGGRHDPEG
jgi:hypothetical protein